MITVCPRCGCGVQVVPVEHRGITMCWVLICASSVGCPWPLRPIIVPAPVAA